MDASSCLAEHDLLLFAAGGLCGEALTRAESHIDTCRGCRLLLAVAAGPSPAIDEPAPLPSALGVFAPGDLVAGRYEVVRLLGAGGMGEVYETVDNTLAERVALKTIGAAAPLDAQGIARLKAEVQTARQVTHPNVCRVFDVGFHLERARTAKNADLTVPFLTMELLVGETLRVRVAREERLDAKEALAILTQMAAGLDAAHAAGIVHADLKSDNVMLVPQAAGRFRAVITDFGLAHQDRVASRTSRSSGALLGGTVGYMAPEQLRGGRPGPAGDIYALGVVLFEMLTGELPFQGDTPLAVALASVKTPPPSLRSFAIEVPASWERVIRRSLDPAAGRRFARAAEMVEALRSVPTSRWSAARKPLVLAGALAAVSVAAVFVARSVPSGATARGEAAPAPAEAVQPSTATRAPRLAHMQSPAAAPTAVTPPRRPSLEPAAPAPHRPPSRAVPASIKTRAHAVRVPKDPGDDDAIDPFTDR